MFLMTELILFSPLAVYACIRIHQRISKPVLKNSFALLCVLLFLGYPLAELLAHRETSGCTRYLVIAGYCCLPYLLYITLCVVAVDLAIALGRVLKLLRPETVSSRRFRSTRLGCYLILPILIVAAGALNNNRLLIREISVELPRRASTLDKLSIVYASDFHLSSITNGRLVERFVSKINALNPDIVLIGGDVLEGHGVENPEKYEAQFRGIRTKYGVYAAPGNHEGFRGGAADFFLRSGMIFLEDAVEKIDDAFYVAGRKDSRFAGRKPVSELLEAAPGNLPTILLDHRPTDLENVSNSRVDLQLSGHTHNGQLFPVNLLLMPIQYELAWGSRKKGNTLFIVSSGVQAWGPPVKTAGNSEILWVKVSFRGTP